MKFALLALLFTSTLFAQPCPQDRANYFCLSPDMAPDSQVQKEDFHRIPTLVSSLFANELKSKNFHLDLRWDSPYFGAGISPYQGRRTMMVLGGTARIKDMTKDAYAALICHELGHILGGAPYQNLSGSEWASREGQSDFFAASICLPRYFKYLGFKNIPSKIEAAGWFLFKSMSPHSSDTRNQPLLRGKQSLPSVKTTEEGYPSVQCRYETFRDPTKRSSCWYAP